MVLTSFHKAAKSDTNYEEQTDHVKKVAEGAAAGYEEVPRGTVQVLVSVEFLGQQRFRAVRTNRRQPEDRGIQVAEDRTASYEHVL